MSPEIFCEETITSGTSMDLSQKGDLLWLSELASDLRWVVSVYEPLMVGAMAQDFWCGGVEESAGE